MAVSTTTNDRFYEYYLLSTDIKPVNGSISNGSTAVEMDTGKVFFFDVDRFKAGQNPWIEPQG